MQETIRLMLHNPQWLQEFEQSRSSLLQATEGWLVDIQHIGSTSIPDGIARPVVDMMAGMTNLQGLNEVAELLSGLNYTRQAVADWCSDELCGMFHKPRVGEVTHTLLVVRHGGSNWKRAISIRQWLASHLADWQKLQNLKKDNLAVGCHALDNYRSAKDTFFSDIEVQIHEKAD